MDPYVEKDEDDDDLEHGYKSFPLAESSNVLMVNGNHGQPRSLQNLGVIARDPGNVKTAKSTTSSDIQKAHSGGGKFHIPFISKEHKYKCARCNRKFTDKNEHADHTTKCIQ